MKKIIILITVLMLSTYGCSDNNQIVEVNEPIVEEIAEEVVVEESEFEYDVPNASSRFSSEDLIYFIMIDRFNDGDLDNNSFEDTDISKENPKAYQGGDLEGIIQKLDYIKDLGATTIWITPIVKNEPYGYHGYWTEDFYEVDPHFGDMDTLKRLVSEAHDRDMKIILDYVVNHTGYKHEWLDDPSKESWFHHNGTITNFRDDNQVENFSLAGLPDLNQDNPEVKAYFFDNVLWWIKETGIDGMRLDTVRHVPKEFWNEFTYIIKQEYPDFYLLGEVWINSSSYLESYHELGIDGLANFPLYEGIKKTFQLYGKASDLKIAINNDQKFSNPELNGIFLDNHDTSRLISNTSKYHEEYLKLGLSFIMTYPSIPVIYYGTEIGLEGKDDPDNRRFMDWDKLGNEMYEYYKTLVEFRDIINNMDLTDFALLKSTPNYITYERTSDSDSIVVLINVSDKEQDVLIENLTLEGSYIDYLSGQEDYLSNGEIIVVPPFTSVLLKKEGSNE